MVPNHPVLLELKSRLHGQRDPSHRLALSVEGGSVRGVVSAAMLEVLTEAGFNGAIFDEVYGSSAGAVNAAAYLTGNIRVAIASYLAIRDRTIIRRSRIVRKGPIIDLEALIERIIGRLTETELQRLIDSQKLRIMATSAHQAKAVAFNAPINREQLVNYLIASCSLPFLAKPKDIDGEHFFDALLSEPIPHQTIIANGFTHILVLSTRPYGYSGGKQRLNALFINRVTAHYGKPLRSLASARRQAAPEFARTLHAQSLKPESSPYILTIAPSGTKDPVGNLSRNIPSIERAGLLGANAMRHQLGLASISDFTLLER